MFKSADKRAAEVALRRRPILPGCHNACAGATRSKSVGVPASMGCPDAKP